MVQPHYTVLVGNVSRSDVFNAAMRPRNDRRNDLQEGRCASRVPAVSLRLLGGEVGCFFSHWCSDLAAYTSVIARIYLFTFMCVVERTVYVIYCAYDTLKFSDLRRQGSS